MAYTESDLQSVQRAILALASGKRVASVRIGETTVEYGQVDLEKLRRLEAQIRADIQAAAGGKRFVLSATSKGL